MASSARSRTRIRSPPIALVRCLCLLLIAATLTAAGPGAALSPLARGRALLTRAATWAGGSAAFARVRTWREESVSLLHGSGEAVRIRTATLWRFPDRMVLAQQTPLGEVAQGFDGANGWGQGVEGVRDAPEVGFLVRQEYERLIVRLFARPDTLRIEAETGLRTIEDVPLRVARVASDVVPDWRLYFASDGRLAGMSYRDLGPSGEAEVLTLLDDWRRAGAGVRVPFASRTRMNGALYSETRVTLARANPALPDSTFTRPRR